MGWTWWCSAPACRPLRRWCRQRGSVVCRSAASRDSLPSYSAGRVIGVTGSSGKTTTTSLLGDMLRQAGLGTLVGGNIGLPLISTLDGEAEQAQVAVMELSSFQLELFSPAYQGEGVDLMRSAASRMVSLAGWSPPVAVITNITPNHLDRHPSMADYILAKSQILAYQQAHDWAVLNADDSISRELQTQVKGQTLTFSLEGPVTQGAFLRGDALVLRWAGVERTDLPPRGAGAPRSA